MDDDVSVLPTFGPLAHTRIPIVHTDTFSFFSNFINIFPFTSITVQKKKGRITGLRDLRARLLLTQTCALRMTRRMEPRREWMRMDRGLPGSSRKRCAQLFPSPSCLRPVSVHFCVPERKGCIYYWVS